MDLLFPVPSPLLVLLILDAEKSIAPKLKFLQSRGASSSSELTEIVSKVPKILGMKEGKSINRYYDFVKDIIEADKSSKFVNLCHSLPESTRQDNKIRNVLVLRELGVSQERLFPLLICGWNPVQGKEKFEISLKKVVEMGFDPTTSKFVDALRVIQGISDKAIEEKVDVYKRLGFDVGDVWSMFKKYPLSMRFSEKKITQKFETLKKCGLLEDEILSVLKFFPQSIASTEQKIDNSIDKFLGLGFSRDEIVMMVKRFPPSLGFSAETIEKKTEFIVKKMNWPLKAVVFFPQVLGYSMEKRIVPRCNVIKALISKGSLGSKLPSLASVLTITDQAFINRYLVKHDDNHIVLELMPWLSSPEIMLHRSEGL